MKTVQDIMRENDSAKKMSDFLVKQKMSYGFKKNYARIRALEFVDQCSQNNVNYHVSVGGLDSIVLFVFLRSIGITAPAVSVSSLEDISIQRVHRALGIGRLKSAKKADGSPWKKNEIIEEYGFPVISKEVAGKIELLQAQTPESKTVRHAIITGETGEYGGYQKNSRMKLAQKWLDLFAGYENENEGTRYAIAPFKCSQKCCYYLKEKPCDDYAKENDSVPFLGLMASEGGRREKSLKMHGCNYWGKTTVRSAPFAIFMRHDLLHLAVEMDAWYHEHWREFKPIVFDKEKSEYVEGEPVHLRSIIPEIYGEIKSTPRSAKEIKRLREQKVAYDEFDVLNKTETTGASRTGCSICGFGLHLEKRPHRFDKLRERNEKEWEYLMYRLITDKKTGETYGWGRVLDYIGVGWEDRIQPVETCEQISIFDKGE